MEIPGFALASFAAVILAVVAGAAAPDQVAFPSDNPREVRSRTGVSVYYVDRGPNPEGDDHRSIMLRYPGGRTERIDSFSRHADVSWSPHGDHLVENNWFGSDVADCRLVTPSPSGASNLSLTSLIVASKFRRISSDVTPSNHLYALCDRWLSPTRIQVELRGYGCKDPCQPARGFHHVLIYDFRSNRLSLPQ